MTVEAKNFKKLVLKVSNEQLQKFEKSIINSAATILDPRFEREHHNFDAASKATHFINEQLRDPKNKNAIATQLQENRKKNSKGIWSYHANLLNQVKNTYSSKSTLNVEFSQYIHKQIRVEMGNCPIRFWSSIP